MVKVSLNITDVEVDSSGVRGFVWPIRREETLAMRDVTERLLIVAARGSGSSDEDASLISILATHAFNEFLSLFQSYTLSHRLASQGYELQLPESSRLLKAVTFGCHPLPPGVIQILQEGPKQSRSRYRWIPHPLRYAYRSVRSDGFSIDNLLPLRPKTNIIAVNRIPLILDLARLSQDKVQFSDYGDWLGPLAEESNEISNVNAASPTTIRATVDAVRTGFSAGNEELPEYLDKYLENWLITASSLARRHLHKLLERPDRLPRRLWTGSGGKVLVRILRHATRRCGGTVTGYDHAMGTGHLLLGAKHLVDFESCDAFVTNTESQASGLRRVLRPDLLLTRTPPEIISAESLHPKDQASGHTESLLPTETVRRAKVRTIIYPSSFYRGEAHYYWVPMPDVVALDWEARLFSRLVKWSYEVLHKPHPGSANLPSKQFYSATGTSLLSDKFEQVANMADAFIFVTPQSRPFISKIRSNTPLIFIDLGLFDWQEEAYEMLSKRCSIVQGWFDEDNRAQVHWADLRSAIDESIYLNDTSFHENYLRGTS